MKKSTIFALVLVYIISFLAVGLFGIATKGYHEVIYVDSIKIDCPDLGDKIKDKTDYRDENPTYKYVAQYEEGLIVRLKAEVYPVETSFPKIAVVYDTEASVGFYTITVVDDYYIHIEFEQIGRALFSVQSTDGKKLQVPVQVTALPSI